MKKLNHLGLLFTDPQDIIPLYDAIDCVNKCHPQEQITKDLLFKCVASDLISLVFDYQGDIHLKTIGNENTPEFVGSYKYVGLVEVQDYELGMERPHDCIWSAIVMPLEIGLLKPYRGSPILTHDFISSSHYFFDVEAEDYPHRRNDAPLLGMNDLKVDHTQIIFAKEQLFQQIKIRHRLSGRYTIEEAASMIAVATGERKMDIEQMLFSAVESSDLIAHPPGKSIPINHKLKLHEHLIYSAEIYWDKLNDWIKTEIPCLDFIFPAANKIPSNTTPIKPGVTKQVIVIAFEGIRFTTENWKHNLANPRKWLVACRATRGNKSTSSTWWPHLIAVALIGKPGLNGEPIKLRQFDRIFSRELKEWSNEWNTLTEMLRD